MRNIIQYIILLVFLMPVTTFATTYYVNGVTGHDSDTCGTLADAPCKSVKRAVENTGDLKNTIKIAAGTYVEDIFFIRDALWPGSYKFVVLEGGWNSNFTGNSGNRADTVLRTGNGTSGWPYLAVVLAGYNNYGTVGLTLKCLSIEHTPSGGIEGGVQVSTKASGKAKLTLNNVYMAGFIDPVLNVQSKGSEWIDVTVTRSFFEQNSISDGSYLYNIIAHSGRIELNINDSRFINNGSTSVNISGVFLSSKNNSLINSRFENTIISGNRSNYHPSLYISTVGTSRQTASLVNTTIVDNICTNKGCGIEAYGNANSHLTLYVTNSIIYANGSSDLYLNEQQSSATVNYMGEYNIVGEYSATGTPGHTTLHETNANPKLNGACHLTGSSPAIDMGICGKWVDPLYSRIAPYKDIDGDKRPGFGKLFGCDIGADEYKPFPWPAFLPAIINH